MPEQQEQAIITLLGNITRDTGQIKTDLAVNTTKTGFIEEHLRTLNGKVIKQEEKQQQTDKELQSQAVQMAQLINAKRRWYEGFSGFFKFVLGVTSTLISAYIINKYF